MFVERVTSKTVCSFTQNFLNQYLDYIYISFDYLYFPVSK